jgi:hypothetical protein
VAANAVAAAPLLDTAALVEAVAVAVAMASVLPPDRATAKEVATAARGSNQHNHSNNVTCQTAIPCHNGWYWGSACHRLKHKQPLKV